MSLSVKINKPDIEYELEKFSPINLDEMNRAKLMKRTDHKFLLNYAQLKEILSELAEHFSILSINGTLNHSYTSLYFDTENLSMYYDHHNKRANRYKIRQRLYNSTGDNFLEIKHKNNKGYTNKIRVETEGMFKKIPYRYFDFVNGNTPYNAFTLKKIMENDFYRFTLTNKERSQRITIDTNLSFWFKNKPLQVDNLVIAEVKSDKENFDRTIFDILKRNHIHPSGMSKYSIGLAMLQKDLKQNNFKQKIHTINKICYAS